jgi:hypothetical protein
MRDNGGRWHAQMSVPVGINSLNSLVCIRPDCVTLVSRTPRVIVSLQIVAARYRNSAS